MGVEYSSTEVQISDRKTLAADSYYMVHSCFDLHYHMAIFDQSVPINFSTLVCKRRVIVGSNILEYVLLPSQNFEQSRR